MNQPKAWHEGLVPIMNSLPVPRRFTDALEPVPVTVRVVWGEPFGVELVETLALAWTSRSVLVRMSDRRLQVNGVWLSPSDVRRRRVVP